MLEKGQCIEQATLKASYGKGFRLKEGQYLKLRNTHGTQAVDMWAIRSDDHSEYLSVENYRSRFSVISVDQGDILISNHRNPMIEIVEDTSAGHHDTVLCGCNADSYRLLGAKGYHRNCADNFHEAAGEFSIKLPFTPGAVNLFLQIVVQKSRVIERQLPTHKPGCHVLMKALADVVVVLSSCPQDITPINGPDRTPRDCDVEIWEDAAAA